MSKKIKSIKAPSWFIKGMSEVTKTQKEVGALFHLDIAKLKKDTEELVDNLRKTDNMDDLDKLGEEFVNGSYSKYRPLIPNLPKEILSRIKSMTDMARNLTEYLWNKIKVDNIDNEFGSASVLFYDIKNKLIIIKE
jgi:hypothetical protein